MNLHVRIMTHAIPYAFGIALTAMVVLTIKQSVFVTNGLIQTESYVTVCREHYLFLRELSFFAI